MSRFFDNHLTSLVRYPMTVKATSIKRGDYIQGLEVDYIEFDLGIVVVYYKAGGFSLYERKDDVQVTRKS